MTVSAIVLLAGLQMLTCEPSYLPVTWRIIREESAARRRRGALPVEGMFRLLILAVLLGSVLGGVAFR